MSTIADYSVFTKAFLTSTDVDFSKLFYPPLSQENSLRYFAVVPLYLDPTLTPREAMNFDWTKLGNEIMWNRVSCRNTNGEFIGNIVRIQPGVREGSIRLVAKVAVPAASGEDLEDIKVNTFVLLRTDSLTSQDLPIAVATISEGYRLHKHLASGNDPLDDVENANYVSFTINHLNGYTSVDFNPDAYVTYDVTDALSRSIDGLHIAFDTASGDLKLLDKDGNVLDQANLPIKADVIIADGEEGYKYVKTDVKQDIHAAKAWMPKGFTAWEAVPEAPYEMQRAALVMGNASTPASRVFVSTKPVVQLPISTQTVEIPHVEIGGSTYMVADLTEQACNLFRVKGDAGSPVYYQVPFSQDKVTITDASTADPAESVQRDVTTSGVDVDVITYKDTLCVLGETGNSGYQRYRALSTNSVKDIHLEGGIVTSGGSSTASRVFVDTHSGSYPISIKSVQFDHVVIGDSIYMVTDKNETECHLRKVKGGAETPTVISHASLLNGSVTYNSDSYPITNKAVDVDVIEYEGTTYVLVGPDGSGLFQARSLDGGSTQLYSGIIVTFGGSTTGEVLGIALADQEGTKMYTFDEGAQHPSEITSISGDKVRWLDIKPLTEVPNHTLKYGLEAFVWTVKGDEYKSNDPFFNLLNESLRALGFHEGDDIALGTNLATLAPTGGVSPLNKVDADDYIHGKNNKATREQDVNTQRAYAKEELVAWNAQHPELKEDQNEGTIIDHTGLDVRHGSITLGCGHFSVGDDDVTRKVNYGIQMNDRSEQLEFTISHTTGAVQFDENGHATNLTSSTLLSIEAGDYISGAPTCLILAEVTRDSSGTPWVTPVRTTTGFQCIHSHTEDTGSRLTIHDYRDNISAVFNPNGYDPIPAIIEVQAIYTHPDAQEETVPAQQMHTYIGAWTTISAEGAPDHPGCRFSCNKIEEWMMAVGLPVPNPNPNPDTTPVENVKLYVVIRVY